MPLTESINELKAQLGDISSCAARMMRAYNGIYMFDMFCNAQLNRTINLVDGFYNLALADNYICAFPLVRLNVDTLQRLYAFQLIEGNIDVIATEIFNGKPISSFKAKPSEGGKRLTDSLLSEKISRLPGLEWVRDVYLAGNGFIHFSDKHIISSMAVETDSRTLTMAVRVGSSFINDDEKEGACIYMTRITKAIIDIIDSWTAHKSTYTKQHSTGL